MPIIDPDTDENLQNALEGVPITFWVEGRIIIQPWDTERRAHADRLEGIAAGLGLIAFRQATSDENAQLHRRWTQRRIGASDIRRYLDARPGAKFNDMVEDLYREEPWNDLKRQSAAAKLRVALSRMKATVVKRFDDVGVERWAPAHVHTGLQPFPVRPLAPVAPDDAQTPVALVADQLHAGAKILRELNIFTPEMLRHDPNLYVDLVRQIYTAVVKP